MWYIHTVEYHIKGGNYDTNYNMDKSWLYNTKWNKSVTRGQICDDSIYMKFPE